MLTKNKIECLENAIKLIKKAMAENAYDGIVMPKLPTVTINQLEALISEYEKEIPVIKVKFINLDGEVLALFPELTNRHNKKLCMSYQHIGQHSEACRSLARRKAIKGPEVDALKIELESIGYKLEVQS
jgi:hypothetical protein